MNDRKPRDGRDRRNNRDGRDNREGRDGRDNRERKDTREGNNTQYTIYLVKNKDILNLKMKTKFLKNIMIKNQDTKNQDLIEEKIIFLFQIPKKMDIQKKVAMKR